MRAVNASDLGLAPDAWDAREPQILVALHAEGRVAFSEVRSTEKFPLAASARRGGNPRGLKDLYLKAGLDCCMCAMFARQRTVDLTQLCACRSVFRVEDVRYRDTSLIKNTVAPDAWDAREAQILVVLHAEGRVAFSEVR